MIRMEHDERYFRSMLGSCLRSQFIGQRLLGHGWTPVDVSPSVDLDCLHHNYPVYNKAHS